MIFANKRQEGKKTKHDVFYLGRDKIQTQNFSIFFFL